MDNSNNKMPLHGFNNLTKSLAFNMFDICYTKTAKDRDAYISYIDEQYNAERLTEILTNVTNIIGAHILNISSQDYEPQGASVTILVCEESNMDALSTNNPETIVGHLDKSHITVHTYPEYHPVDGVATFRADIDVSTCGQISPLNALGYLIRSFDADIMTLDYRIRGFTRDLTGRKLFYDHDITSIQNYVPPEERIKYHFIDVNVYQENIFHTKCKLREFDLDDYLFGFSKDEIHPGEAKDIERKLRREMDEIFYGRNLLGPY